jgi:hypothetical protein
MFMGYDSLHLSKSNPFSFCMQSFDGWNWYVSSSVRLATARSGFAAVMSSSEKAHCVNGNNGSGANKN